MEQFVVVTINEPALVPVNVHTFMAERLDKTDILLKQEEVLHL